MSAQHRPASRRDSRLALMPSAARGHSARRDFARSTAGENRSEMDFRAPIGAD
jgi:hypothetical protein